MAAAIEDFGAVALRQPAIEIRPLADPGPMDQLIASMDQIDDLIAVSKNGVRPLFERMGDLGFDARRLAGVRVHAFGSSTAEQFLAHGVRPDRVSTAADAESFIESAQSNFIDRRVAVIHADRTAEDWSAMLAGAASVRAVAGYQNIDVTDPSDAVRHAMAAGGVDWVAVTSSAIARRLADWFGEDLKRCRLASIGRSTTATLRDLGLEVAAQPAVPSAANLVQAIVDASGTEA